MVFVKRMIFGFWVCVALSVSLNSNLSFAEDALFVDENGNVGIGVSQPSTKLEVNGSTKINDPSSNFNGVTELNWAGYVQGNQSISVSFSHEPSSTFEITSMFGHYGQLSTHGCVRKSFVANHSGGALSVIDVVNTETNNSGKWLISRNNDQIIITKEAGSYNGGGHYSITVRGNSILNVVP